MRSTGKLARIFLTFDDGLARSCLRAAEYLTTQGITATFFVVPGWIDGTCEYSDSDNPPGSHVSWEDCVYLQSLGHIVGSHSQSHPDLAKTDEVTIKTEILDSKHNIEKQLPGICRTFASPFNRCTEAIIRIAAENYDLVRVGPHITREMLTLEANYPVFPSISYRGKLLEDIRSHGLDCLSPIMRRNAVILQCHGFDGEGWASRPFEEFEGFVSEHRDLFGQEDLVTWYCTGSC